jgi:hypothetical protein
VLPGREAASLQVGQTFTAIWRKLTAMLIFIKKKFRYFSAIFDLFVQVST